MTLRPLPMALLKGVPVPIPPPTDADRETAHKLLDDVTTVVFVRDVVAFAEALATARAEEREACATIADEHALMHPRGSARHDGANGIASAIRARGQR